MGFSDMIVLTFPAVGKLEESIILPRPNVNPCIRIGRKRKQCMIRFEQVGHSVRMVHLPCMFRPVPAASSVTSGEKDHGGVLWMTLGLRRSRPQSVPIRPTKTAYSTHFFGGFLSIFLTHHPSDLAVEITRRPCSYLMHRPNLHHHARRDVDVQSQLRRGRTSTS